jgi:uncharacterized protein YggL (DUF469 family)
MKKRFRKKKHLGEYKVFGISIAIRLRSKTIYDDFHHAFILQAIEKNGCWFGGGGFEDKMEGFIELGSIRNDPHAKRKSIIQWLESRNDVAKFHVGEITDA